MTFLISGATCQVMTNTAMKTAYWLMKSEPEVYSAQKWEKDGKTLWEGVRNYQARNYMIVDMKIGDTVLFYHSNCEKPGIYAVGTVTQLAQPDPTQFNKKSEYYDEKSSRENPRWKCVEVTFERHLQNPVLLETIKRQKKLESMILLRASRLSVQPVTKAEAIALLAMSGSKEKNEVQP